MDDLTTDQRAAMLLAWDAKTPEEIRSAIGGMLNASIHEIWITLAMEAYRRRVLERLLLEHLGGGPG